MMEARMMLEVGMLPQIIADATNNDLKALKAILDRADAAKPSAEFEAYDAEFHHHLALSARNDLLFKFSESSLKRAKAPNGDAPGKIRRCHGCAGPTRTNIAGSSRRSAIAISKRRPPP
jgi:DNA-binding GntR family transcriptional regulator